MTHSSMNIAKYPGFRVYPVFELFWPNTPDLTHSSRNIAKTGLKQHVFGPYPGKRPVLALFWPVLAIFPLFDPFWVILAKTAVLTDSSRK